MGLLGDLGGGRGSQVQELQQLRPRRRHAFLRGFDLRATGPGSSFFGVHLPVIDETFFIWKQKAADHAWREGFGYPTVSGFAGHSE